MTRRAVSQWLKVYRERSVDALLYKRVSKKTARLSPQQKEELVSMLCRGPEFFGCAGQVWTQDRVGALIEKNSASPIIVTMWAGF